MSKFLYPIRKLKIETWIKYWLLKRTQSSILPKEYQQVNYIESSGTQYIDTGVNVKGSMIIDIVTAITKANDQQAIFGASGVPNSSSQLRLYTGQNGDVDKLQYNYGSIGSVISYNRVRHNYKDKIYFW